MENKKIVILGNKSQATNVVFNSLHKNFGITAAIIEDSESRSLFFKRRIKKLGFFTVTGQILFQIFIAKPLGYLSRKRQHEIINENRLDTSGIPNEKLKLVSSVNSATTISLLQDINPGLVIVNGTRIISKKVLTSVNCSFINIHAGITPTYRGVHGTYWALVNNDLKNSGVTVHFVDEGIDTGNIIYQSYVVPAKADNFSTYTLLQLAEGLKILNMAVRDYFNNEIVELKERKTESFLWFHPTIWKYLYYRLIKGVK